MKKIIYSVLVVAVLLSLAIVSCKSSGMTQKEVNQAFDAVYKSYRSHLNLEGAKNYVVVKGDTLSSITRGQYGSANGYYFPLIMLASSEIIKDPDLIQPGMKLVVPDFDKNTHDSNAKPSIKAYFKDIAGVYNKKGKIGDDITRDRLLEIASSL